MTIGGTTFHTLLFGSVRRSLITLVLVAVLPILAILLHTGHELRQQVVHEAEDAALRQVQAMAAHHTQIIANTRLLLMALAESSEVRTLNAQACRELLANILARNSAYAGLSLVDDRGLAVVTVPADRATAQNDAALLHSALASGQFTVGNYTLLPGEHRVVVRFAQPVQDGSGKAQGLLVADFDLSYLGGLFADILLPERSVFTLTDATGLRLTRWPEPEKYTWVRDLPQMVHRMSSGQEEGTFFEVGVDGVSRLYGFKRLHFQNAAFPYLMIRLGIPVDKALAKARQVLIRSVGLLVLATGLTLLIAWFVSDITMIRRFRRLIEATGRVKAGDLEVRIGAEAGSGELGQLAAAFDGMTESLAVKEQARSLAEEELRQLNETLEGRVARRTEELAAANSDLLHTLEDLQRMQKQLVLSEKLAALGELVAGVAHEINTPVGVALSAGSTLAEKNRALGDLFAHGEMKRSDLSQFLEESHEGTEMILVNLNRASDLIRSFKMVAADQVSEHRRPFTVRSYIDEILLSLRPKLKKTAHTVEVRCDEAMTIDSYPGAFSQILTNLIINSLTHGFTPEQAGHITIEVQCQEKQLLLRYTDDGRGMTPEVRDRIFEPFFTTARGQGNTGLGLHIVFNIVTRTLGGTIVCESEPGQGTSFVMTLPIRETPNA